MSHWCRCRHAASADFALPGAESHYPPDLELEPTHLDIEIALDLEAQTCTGMVTHTLTARRAGAQRIELNAVDFADLEVVSKHPLTSSYDGERITVVFDSPCAKGEERAVGIRYQVEQPVAGLYFSKPGEDAPDRPWYAATDHETERARHWLPCVDLPAVRPTLAFHITAAQRFTILANGELEREEEHDNGKTTAHWKLDHPCPSYLTCVVVGDLVRADDGAFQDIPMAYFSTPPATPEDLKRSFGRTGEMLAWLTERLGTHFPYPKYFQFALPGFGGAMENISLVSWDDVFVLDEELATEMGWLVDQINIHEMAHSYFGDLVVCRHFEHAWLKESWATYIETCWLEHKYGDDEMRYDLFRNARSYFREADEDYMRPIVLRTYSSSFDLYDAHLYPGGACRLHMLRKLLGDDVFWAAVQDYIQTYAERVVETHDFRRMLEKHSGRSLVRFFELWLESPGYPKLKVSFSYDREKKQGTFEVEQKQVDKDAGVPVFELETELAWGAASGALTTRSVKLHKAKHTFVVGMDEEPKQVRVDPHGKVLISLDFNPGDERMRKQLVAAGDVVGRILAAQVLAKTGRAQNIRAIAEAYRDESFWGVRAEMARALSDSKSQDGHNALLEIAAEEQDPMVLETVIRGLSAYRGGATARVLTKRLEDGLTPRAAAAAWEMLGAQRDEAPLALIAEAAARDSYHAVEQGGALAGLGETWQEAAFERLSALVQPGAVSYRARPRAARALGALSVGVSRETRERIVELLVDLLRDAEDRVRLGAVAGLRSVGDASALSALEALSQRLPRQQAVGVHRAIASIRAAAAEPKGAMASQITELEERIRKLEKLVDTLQSKVEDT